MLFKSNEPPPRVREEHNVSLAAFKLTAGYQFSVAAAASSSSTQTPQREGSTAEVGTLCK